MVKGGMRHRLSRRRSTRGRLDEPEGEERRGNSPPVVMRPLPTTLESPFLPSRQMVDGTPQVG